MSNEEEVIRLFLKSGYQISKKALPLILTDPEKIIQNISKLKPRPFIITENHAKKILSPSGKTRIKVKVLKKYEFPKKEITIDDYVKHLQTKYKKVRDILLERMDKKKLISINKITLQTKTFSIIGIVREKGENNVLLEDLSGEVLVFFDTIMKPKLKEINLDDVIGVNCKRNKESFFVKILYFPEIPSIREINRSEEEIKIAFLFNLSLLTKKQKDLFNTNRSPSSVFIFTDDSKIMEESINPNLIKIPKDSPPTLFQLNKIKILILQKNPFKPLVNINFNFFTSILRKRCIFVPFNSKICTGFDFVLEETPDIIVSNFDINLHKNYKGATIISNSDPNKYFLINLKTREVVEKSIKS
jgi:DNA polymerase II small subunit/DNA polymerase delta subunit B